MSMFRDRKHAGELLAELLAGYRGSTEAVILALPRGGVPVAAVIARELALPLDVFLVHKIGAPSGRSLPSALWLQMASWCSMRGPLQ